MKMCVVCVTSEARTYLLRAANVWWRCAHFYRNNICMDIAHIYYMSVELQHLRTINVAFDMSNAFDTINIHTLIRKLLQTNIPQSQSSSQTTSRDAKPTQQIENTHPHNVNSKLAFHKVASFHQHYSTFTLQTYHHPEHWFRS